MSENEKLREALILANNHIGGGITDERKTYAVLEAIGAALEATHPAADKEQRGLEPVTERNSGPFAAGSSASAKAGGHDNKAPELCAGCGHPKEAHIYHEGACRPGFVCESACNAYRAQPKASVPAEGVEFATEPDGIQLTRQRLTEMRDAYWKQGLFDVARACDMALATPPKAEGEGEALEGLLAWAEASQRHGNLVQEGRPGAFNHTSVRWNEVVWRIKSALAALRLR